MWLLKFHVSFSVLCMLTFYGFWKIYREQIKENGYGGNEKEKAFFVCNLDIFYSVYERSYAYFTVSDDYENKR